MGPFANESFDALEERKAGVGQKMMVKVIPSG
jgi:hypothetical protein